MSRAGVLYSKETQAVLPQRESPAAICSAGAGAAGAAAGVLLVLLLVLLPADSCMP